MAMSAGGKGGVKNEINVTPLVDVVLVLLIIFMVVTPMLQRGKDVRLPQVSKPDDEKKETDPIIMSVTTDKKIWIESTSYPEAQAEVELAAKLRESPTKPMKGVGLGVQERKK
jgi:biopolymer transport protein TolR